MWIVASSLRQPGQFATMSTTSRQFISRYGGPIALGAILLVGAALRLAALRFELPAVYHPDEDALVMPAMNIIKTGDWDPLRMDYGSLVIYLQVPVMALVYLLSALSGFITSPTDLIIMERGAFPGVFPHPEYVLGARLLSALFGIATILLVYMLANRLGGRRLGLIAAGLAALTPDLVVHSHYATADSIMVTLTVLALYLIVRAYDTWETDSAWPYIGAGLVCGLAMAAKLQGAVLVAPLALVPLLRARGLDDLLNGRVVGGLLAVAGGYLLATPYAILNTPKLLEFTSLVLRIYARPGHVPQGSTLVWQASEWFTGRNAAMMLAAVPGFVLSWRAWGRRALLPNSYAMIVILLALTATTRETRTWLPVAPVACLWAALALDTLLTAIGRRSSLKAWQRGAAAAALMAVVALPLLVNSATGNKNLNGEDVRTEVQYWLEANVPPGEGVAFDRFWSNIDPDVWPVTLVFGHYGRELSWYSDQGVRYVVASDVIHNDDRLSAEEEASYNALTGQMCLVQQVNGRFLAVDDRDYWIYQTPPCEKR